MAAAQTETHLNESNREHLQQDQPNELGNNSLHNGTERNGSVRSPNAKTRMPNHNFSVDMNQYRHEMNTGPPMHNNDQNSSEDDISSKINSDKLYPTNDQNNSDDHLVYNKALSESVSGSSVQGYGMPFSQRTNYGHLDHNPMQMGNGNENSISRNAASNQFDQQNRNLYPNSKPIPSSRSPNTPSGGLPPGPVGSFIPHGHPHQRLMSGQSISQQMGPTPTLNQLLQSSNPVHRYQNSYDYGMQKPNEAVQSNIPFNHGWGSIDNTST